MMPQISQKYFSEAGHCLAFGINIASISLALIATEAMLRFYYNRHNPPPLERNRRGEEIHPGWGKMFNWLQQEGFLPEGECIINLQWLLVNYRNSIAHGRMHSEKHKEEISALETIEIFHKCLKTCLILMAQEVQKPNLRIHLILPQELDFDVLLAAYIFNWNLELPPLQINPASDIGQLKFDSSVEKGTLLDSTLNEEQLLSCSENSCLSKIVLNRLRVQDNFVATIQNLVEYTDICYRNNTLANRFPNQDEQIELKHLLNCIIETEKDQFLILSKAWDVFEKFLNTSTEIHKNIYSISFANSNFFHL